MQDKFQQFTKDYYNMLGHIQCFCEIGHTCSGCWAKEKTQKSLDDLLKELNWKTD